MNPCFFAIRSQKERRAVTALRENLSMFISIGSEHFLYSIRVKQRGVNIDAFFSKGL